MNTSSFSLKNTLILNSIFNDPADPQKYQLIKKLIDNALNISCLKIQSLDIPIIKEKLDEDFCASDYIITKDNGEKIIVEIVFAKNTELNMGKMFHNLFILYGEQENFNSDYPFTIYKSYQITFIDGLNLDKFMEVYQIKNQLGAVREAGIFNKHIEINISYINKILEEKTIDDLTVLEAFAYLLENGIDQNVIKYTFSKSKNKENTDNE